MKTSLITDVSGVASHAEELSESSNIIFLNSEMKLLNSSLQLSLAGVDISLICLLSWNFYEKFLFSYAVFPLWICILRGTLLGGCWAALFIVFSLAMPTFELVQSSWWLLCAFCSWLVGLVRGMRICGWNILNFKHWEWIPTWPFEVNGHICYILQDLGHGIPVFCFWFG